MAEAIESLTDLEFVANEAIRKVLRELSDGDLLRITKPIGFVGGGRSWQIINYAAQELWIRFAKVCEYE